MKESARYVKIVEWSDEDQCQIAHCLEFPSLAGHGNSIEHALGEIRRAVQASIDWLREDGEPVPEPMGKRR